MPYLAHVSHINMPYVSRTSHVSHENMPYLSTCLISQRASSLNVHCLSMCIVRHESCLAYQRAHSHVFMSHVSRMNESRLTYGRHDSLMCETRISTCCVSHMNESCLLYGGAMAEFVRGCRVLQCVAVCCSVLQRVAEWSYG